MSSAPFSNAPNNHQSSVRTNNHPREQNSAHEQYVNDRLLPLEPASQSTPPFTFYFDDAYIPHSFTPSPPPASFLDNILNPAEPDLYSFDFRPVSPPRRRTRTRSPIISEMPSTRSARLPNGYVDLTNESDVHSSQRRVRRESPAAGPSAKRRRRSDGTAAALGTSKPADKIEEIDLSDEKTTVQDVLQKQQVTAVKTPQVHEEKPTKLNTFTCVICMDAPTDLTSTSCGHIFCHTCLMEALIVGESRSSPNEPKRSQCPVCRKSILRSKASDIIPLLLKKGLATQPRKSTASKIT